MENDHRESTRLERLNDRLQAKARQQAQAHPEFETDDLFQEMALFVLENEDKHQNWPDDQVMAWAHYKCLHLNTRGRNYLNQVEATDTFEKFDNSYEESPEFAEKESFTDWLEDKWTIEEIFSICTSEEKTIVKGLWDGRYLYEIAKELEISPQSMSVRRDRIMKKAAATMTL